MARRKDHAEEVAKSQPRDEISPRLFNIGEAAKYMACSVWFVRTMIWGGRIPYLKLGKGYQLDRGDLDEFIDSEKQKGW